MISKSKVLLAGPVPPPYGGIPKYVKDLLTSSIINNYNLIIFNTSVPNLIRSFSKNFGRNYKLFLSDGFLSAMKLILHVQYSFFRYIFCLLKNRPKIVHVFTPSYWGFWRSCIYILIAKLLNRKIIFHLLNAIDIFWHDSSYFLKKLITFVLNRCDVLLVQSNGIKHFVNQISKSKVVSIYNGVDNSIFYYKNRKTNKSKIISVAALSRNKGTDDLLKVIQVLKSKNLQFHVTIIGRGNIESYENIASSLDIKEYVTFAGVVEDDQKINYLANSDIFILPSYAEGQPLSILEAMSSGLPIVSTTVGSIPEIVKNGENGFLTLPGDIDNIARNIQTLIADNNLIKKMSNENYRLAREKFNINRVFQEIENVYNEME